MNTKDTHVTDNDSASLGSKIEVTSSRLDRRKNNVRLLSSSLSSRIRYGWASPGVLTVAGCTGYLAAEWLHRPKNSTQSPHQRSSRSMKRLRRAAMPKVMLLVKLAMDMKRLWAKAPMASTTGVRLRTDEDRLHEHTIN